MLIKTLAFLSSLLLLIPMADAQSCNSYFDFKTGTVFELSSYSKKDKLESSAKYIVNDVTSSADMTSFDMSVDIKDEKGKSINTADYAVECKDGIYHIDVSRMISPQLLDAYNDMEMEVDGTALEFPNELAVGQTLPGGNCNLKVSSNGMKIMTITCNISDRTVEAEESITTPVGTFDCYKMTYTSEVKIGLKIKSSVTEWYAKGIGLVKSEMYNKKGKLESYTMLTDFKTP